MYHNFLNYFSIVGNLVYFQISCLIHDTAMNTKMKTFLPISYDFFTIKKSRSGVKGYDYSEVLVHIVNCFL